MFVNEDTCFIFLLLIVTLHGVFTLNIIKFVFTMFRVSLELPWLWYFAQFLSGGLQQSIYV